MNRARESASGTLILSTSTRLARVVDRVRERMLFYGCVMLLRETRLALRAVDSEMAFVLELTDRHRREANGGPAPPVAP